MNDPGAIAAVPAAGLLSEYYEALMAAHGPQHWWPGRSRFEIIVGAILVQNTSWTNVTEAVRNLRRAAILTPRALGAMPPTTVEALIRPAGYFRQKTRTLIGFTAFLRAEYGYSLDRMFRTPTEILRERLLGLRGIGPETADSILLYAGNHPVFVVDAYARRILGRHGIADPSARYGQLRRFVEAALPRDPQVLNEFHALIVLTAKTYCRKAESRCDQCPLRPFLVPNAVGPSPAPAI